MVIEGILVSCISEETLLELRETLPRVGTQDLLSSYLERSIVVEPSEHLHLCRDPDDDKFIECAIAADASFIITGDGALLEIRECRGVRIVTPAEFLRRHGSI